MFLVRTAFWLIVLVLLLPTDEQQQSEVYGTAEAAVKDVGSFCDRNPGVCATGKDAFDVFLQKAEFGAQMLMEFVTDQTSGTANDAEAPSVDDNATVEPDGAKGASLDQAGVAQVNIDSWTVAPVTVDSVRAETSGSQSTLSPEDLEPAWNGPRSAGT